MYTKDEIKLLRENFWTLLGARSKKILSENFRKQWIQHRTGINGLELKFSVTRNSAMVMIELNHRNEDKRIAQFEKLLEYKPIIEQEFENGLQWELLHTRSAGNEVCRIYTILNNVDMHKKEDWPEMFDFMTSNMIKLENNFIEIWDILKEELK